ncbi:hypothetical protein B0H11DRAFT_2366197 [Mycena galericulata]|nr:hypothetical protein B0H11DRAFT_2366197 [Mycena galericulata]
MISSQGVERAHFGISRGQWRAPPASSQSPGMTSSQGWRDSERGEHGRDSVLIFGILKEVGTATGSRSRSSGQAEILVAESSEGGQEAEEEIIKVHSDRHTEWSDAEKVVYLKKQHLFQPIQRNNAAQGSLTSLKSTLEVVLCTSDSHQHAADLQDNQPENLMPAMEGESTTNRLMSDLDALPVYNANKARDGGSKDSKDTNDGWAQPPVTEPDPVNPADPSSLFAPASAEPNCVARADTDSLNEHEQTYSEHLNWTSHLPGILFNINFGLDSPRIGDLEGGCNE